MEKKLSLHGKAEWAGARKVLAALKRAHRIKGPVKLAGAPTPVKRRKKSNPRRRNIAGFIDGSGVFHPIRSGLRAVHKGKRTTYRAAKTGYSRKKAGERPRPKARSKKRNPKRLSKKQEFLRRMRLGRLRAARRRRRS